MYLRVYVESCAANDYLTIALFAIYDNWNIFERDELITSPSIKVNVGMRTSQNGSFTWRMFSTFVLNLAIANTVEFVMVQYRLDIDVYIYSKKTAKMRI